MIARRSAPRNGVATATDKIKLTFDVAALYLQTKEPATCHCLQPALSGPPARCWGLIELLLHLRQANWPCSRCGPWRDTGTSHACQIQPASSYEAPP